MFDTATPSVEKKDTVERKMQKIKGVAKNTKARSNACLRGCTVPSPVARRPLSKPHGYLCEVIADL